MSPGPDYCAVALQAETTTAFKQAFHDLAQAQGARCRPDLDQLAWSLNDRFRKFLGSRTLAQVLFEDPFDQNVDILLIVLRSANSPL
jgi:hypothetical protein